nr:hypothetical protein [Marinicella sp. W31]MDC2879797.1 hypothetical protein [Marinicella sp. W31]
MVVDPEAQKREIEARYAALCARVDAAAGSSREDEALRQAFAELAAMMIAYAHDSGSKQTLLDALSRDNESGSSHTRINLAARAEKHPGKRQRLNADQPMRPVESASW